MFICHSLGGLVCKKTEFSTDLFAHEGLLILIQALITANEMDRYQCILDSTKAIFFFGTPHQGSATADRVNQISPILNLLNLSYLGKGRSRPELIADLSAKSKQLDDLSSSFVGRASKIPFIMTFYEEITFRGQVVSRLLLHSFSQLSYAVLLQFLIHLYRELL